MKGKIIILVGILLIIISLMYVSALESDWIEGFNPKTGEVRNGGNVPSNYSGEIKCESSPCSFTINGTSIGFADKTSDGQFNNIHAILSSNIPSVYMVYYSLSSENYTVWRNTNVPCQNCTFFPGDYNGDSISDIVGYSNYLFISSDIPTCVDTDNGKDYYTKGTTKLVYADGSEIDSNTDACSLGEPDKLIEYYCEGDSAMSEIYDCGASGCNDGACVFDSVGSLSTELLNPVSKIFYYALSPYFTWGNISLKIGKEAVLLPVSGDFDGDNKTDIVTYDSSGYIYYYLSSENYGSFRFMRMPCENCSIISGDYNGDRLSDIVGYNQESKTIHFALSPNYEWQSSEIPCTNCTFFPGDYNGDGVSDILGLSNETEKKIYFAISPDWVWNYALVSLCPEGENCNFLPVSGDFDGDNKSDIVAYNPQNGKIFYSLSSNNYHSWSSSINTPCIDCTAIPGDYDSDGKSDLVLYGSKIQSIKLISPFQNDIYRIGDIIKINGTVPTNNLANYKIEYSLSEEPEKWSSVGISLMNRGAMPITEGVLGTWNTSVLTTGFYTIRLTAYLNDGKSYQEEISPIYLDSTLKKGWPQRIGYDCDNASNDDCYLAGYLEPVVEDINNDNQKEIIVYKAGKPPKILVYKSNGSLFWKKEVGENLVYGLHIPLVGDINNDGFKEIIVYNHGEMDSADYPSQIFAFKYDGSILWKSSILFHNKLNMLMADLNNDNKKEIVINGNDAYLERKMMILNNQGGIIHEWALESSSWSTDIMSSPAVGNFDDDTDLEIVSAGPSAGAGSSFDENGNDLGYNNTGVIYVYNMDGSIVSGWPRYTDGVMFSSPVVGDINGDGKDEIVIGTYYNSDIFPDDRYGGVYAFDKNGNVLSGWPIEKGYTFLSTPALGDINKDSDLEIAISTVRTNNNQGGTYLLDGSGQILPGWPIETPGFSLYSEIFADVDGDGVADIVTTDGEGVYAWKIDGSLINGFPKLTEFNAEAPAVITDLDNDGKTELIASSDMDRPDSPEEGANKNRGSIYVWELDVPYQKSAMVWPMFMHDVQHTGNYNLSK